MLSSKEPIIPSSWSNHQGNVKTVLEWKKFRKVLNNSQKEPLGGLQDLHLLELGYHKYEPYYAYQQTGENCRLCNKINEDNLQHHLFECSETNQYWQQVTRIERKYDNVLGNSKLNKKAMIEINLFVRKVLGVVKAKRRRQSEIELNSSAVV
ncbi:hypothetical protein KGF54_001881 [Candida jiufengensis]|uniref:uncharacterized protein n=1 Tax=Candida jiufengensis TaxID=497108 RepID=UPI00222507BE|nr:uncharacterized protein KGF54_001881 [Candida jiufengensis]KAI5955320.1 hypothetical protein KGF54_001881 [Candida jiufengensis]